MSALPVPARHALPRPSRRAPIVVGLVNNMPDAALRSTERQFRELLTEAAGRTPVILRIFSFPGLARGALGRQHVHDHHEDIANLWGAELDGLIVTGTEPQTADLWNEPSRPMLTELVDWASERGIATIWSCLAAHVAVFYLDGIERHAIGGKLSGVFECAKASDHPLLASAAEHWVTPHSRCNELRAADLARCGYQLLSHSETAGADMFVKESQPLFLFLQGHPEYDASALFREYRRDIGRFLDGHSERYPDLPESYFDAAAKAALLAFRERAMHARGREVLTPFPTEIARSLSSPWREVALACYAAWLSSLVGRRHHPSAARPPGRPSRGVSRVAVAYG